MPTNTRTTAELEELVRDGDRTITPAAIAAARQREDHAALLDEADRRAGIRDDAAQRARDIAALRADIEAIADDTGAQHGYVIAAVAALEDLITSVQARADTVHQLGGRARALGIPELDGMNNFGDDSAIGWRLDPATRTVTRLRIDDRMLTSVDPRHVLNGLVREFLVAHKLASTDFVPHKPVTDLLSDQDQQLVPPETARVRLLRRHGHRAAGTVAAYELTTANWLIAKQMAEPAA